MSSSYPRISQRCSPPMTVSDTNTSKRRCLMPTAHRSCTSTLHGPGSPCAYRLSNCVQQETQAPYSASNSRSCRYRTSVCETSGAQRDTLARYHPAIKNSPKKSPPSDTKTIAEKIDSASSIVFVGRYIFGESGLTVAPAFCFRNSHPRSVR